MHRALLLSIAVILACPGAVLAQAGSCQLIENEYTDRRMEGGYAVVFIQGPLLVRCAGGAEIRAQVGNLYEVTREIHLSGNVSFRDPERRLNSQQATYSSVTGRLYATGEVVFTDETEGMTLRGPELEYYRAIPGRPLAQAIATQRPRMHLQPREREGSTRPADAEPVEIDADRMTMVGNDQFTAVGRVEIRRSDFNADSREARVDRASNRMELRGEARVHSEQYNLAAESIDVDMIDDRLDHVLARQNAVLVGEDLRIDSSELRLFFSDDLLQRMVARTEGEAAPRPVASARSFRLEADSLDAILPNQRLDHVTAIGAARGESLDTTNLPDARLSAPAPSGSLTAGDHDWILGDTVIGYFVAADTSTLAAETETASADETGGAETDASNAAREVTLDRVIARGSARSLYRVESNQQGNAGRRGLNYLAGEMIELSFRSGELSQADVRGLQHGLYLDPTPPAAPSPDEPSPETPDAPEPPQTTTTTANPTRRGA